MMKYSKLCLNDSTAHGWALRVDEGREHRVLLELQRRPLPSPSPGSQADKASRAAWSAVEAAARQRLDVPPPSPSPSPLQLRPTPSQASSLTVMRALDAAVRRAPVFTTRRHDAHDAETLFTEAWQKRRGEECDLQQEEERGRAERVAMAQVEGGGPLRTRQLPRRANLAAWAGVEAAAFCVTTPSPRRGVQRLGQLKQPSLLATTPSRGQLLAAWLRHASEVGFAEQQQVQQIPTLPPRRIASVAESPRWRAWLDAFDVFEHSRARTLGD